MAIDIHAHTLTPSIIDTARTGGSFGGMAFDRDSRGRLAIVCGESRSVLPWQDYEASIDARVRMMDSLGVDMHVLSLSPMLYHYSTPPDAAVHFATRINDEIADIVRTHPARFGGFAFLPLQDPDAAAAELRRAVSELGLRGGAIGTHVNGRNLDECGLDPLFAVAEELRVPLFVHPAHARAQQLLDRWHLRNLIGNPLETTIALSGLIFGGVLDRYPALTLCLAHGGGYGCVAAGRMDHGRDVRPELESTCQSPPTQYLDRVYVDSLVFDEAGLNGVLARFGPGQVVLGTDYPADMGQRRPVEWLRSLHLSPETTQAILRNNALRLLGDEVAPASSGRARTERAAAAEPIADLGSGGPGGVA